jgi:NAD(P)-dependent dehydrogenase (short-subunit alcohol dehydrogenase family)
MTTIKDRIIVITGSSRGFGYAIAEAMLKAGATVVVTSRKQEALERALNGLQVLGPVRGELCDVTDPQQVEHLAAATIKQFGRIDIWVNNAGYSSVAGHVIEVDPQEALNLFKTNDMGTLHGTRSALAHMLPRGEGTLVNIYGNGSFLRPASPTGFYGATKAWMTSFTRTLAKEIEGRGVQVVGFSPGMMLTDMLTETTVVGEGAKETMKRYGFVLRMLARKPEKSAQDLVNFLKSNRKMFVEYRVVKPWTPFFGILRILWENLTGTGHAPDYTIKYK